MLSLCPHAILKAFVFAGAFAGETPTSVSASSSDDNFRALLTFSADTTGVSTSADLTVRLPFHQHFDYNAAIDWGDGGTSGNVAWSADPTDNSKVFSDADKLNFTHTYSSIQVLNRDDSKIVK
jgi:hypothetical protein